MSVISLVASLRTANVDCECNEVFHCLQRRAALTRGNVTVPG